MENKFRIKLNLFDGIVLAVALCAALVLGYLTLKPAPAPVEGEAPAVSTVRYTVRFQRMLEGTAQLVQPGDVLTDNIKNYNIGTVEHVEIVPSRVEAVDPEGRRIVQAQVDGLEDAIVTVVAQGTMGSNALLLDGGFTLRANTTAYIRGEGYMASGPVMHIEREGQ